MGRLTEPLGLMSDTGMRVPFEPASSCGRAVPEWARPHPPDWRAFLRERGWRPEDLAPARLADPEPYIAEILQQLHRLDYLSDDAVDAAHDHAVDVARDGGGQAAEAALDFGGIAYTVSDALADEDFTRWLRVCQLVGGDPPDWTFDTGGWKAWLLGTAYGYPACCVEAYCRAEPERLAALLDGPGADADDPRLALPAEWQPGYIQCPECAMRLRAEYQLVACQLTLPIGEAAS